MMDSTKDQQPILTSHLFGKLHDSLVSLLQGLADEDWGRSALPKWSVKDVAAHLLDTALRRLSIARDGWWGEAFNGSTPEEFTAFLNRLNNDWVQGCRRLSPQILTGLVDVTGRELAEYMRSLDPFAPAAFPVSWAGEDRSQNWFDIAREYTERWHHEQQIREAVHKPGIMTRELYAPVVATFMRVLPHTYRNCPAEVGTSIHFHVTSESGGEWTLIRSQHGWKLVDGGTGEYASSITIPVEIAWKLFTKGLTREKAGNQIEVSGDTALAQPVFGATAIVG